VGVSAYNDQNPQAEAYATQNQFAICRLLI
jgi:hypothetical protein